jgi:hypothetical protein
MHSSYVSNHVHIVFNRVKVIPEDLQPKLGAYIVGIAKNVMGAPACPGVPWGLSFETWVPATNLPWTPMT